MHIKYNKKAYVSAKSTHLDQTVTGLCCQHNLFTTNMFLAKACSLHWGTSLYRTFRACIGPILPSATESGISLKVTVCT